MKINKETMCVLIRKSVYLFLYFVDKVFMKKNNLFILCYHSFSTDNWFHSVKLPEFKKQIALLKKEGYKFITIDDVHDHITGKKTIKSPSVVITIDDGYSDVVSAVDCFDKENIIPTLFLVSDGESVNRKEINCNKRLLSYKEIIELQKRGWKIGSHSMTHSNLAKLDKEKLTGEIANSKKALEKTLNSKVNYFAYPFGSYNVSVLKKVERAGYKLALTMDDGMIRKRDNIFKIPRIGVNNTHSISEFKTLYSPSVIKFRKIVKTFLH